MMTVQKDAKGTVSLLEVGKQKLMQKLQKVKTIPTSEVSERNSQKVNCNRPMMKTVLTTSETGSMDSTFAQLCYDAASLASYHVFKAQKRRHMICLECESEVTSTFQL